MEAQARCIGRQELEGMRERLEAMLEQKAEELRSVLVDAVRMIDDGAFMDQVRGEYADDVMDAKLSTIESYRKTRRNYVKAIDELFRPRY